MIIFQEDYSGIGTGEFIDETSGYLKEAMVNIKKNIVVGVVSHVGYNNKPQRFDTYEFRAISCNNEIMKKKVSFKTVQEAVEYGRKYFGIMGKIGNELCNRSGK